MNYSTIDLTGGNKLYYLLLNSRMIELYTNAYVEEIIENNIISKLIISNKEIKVGDKFNHDVKGIPSSYEICKIERGANVDKRYKYKYTLFSHLKNKSTSYILPCLGNNNNYFFADSYLVNCYISKDKKLLYLMYRFTTSKDYSNIEKNLTSHLRYVKIDNSVEGMDIYIMSIPEMHLEDVKIFLKGKYSKLSNLLKEKIKTFYKLPNNSKMWQILNKDAKLSKHLETKLGCSLYGVDLEEKPNPEEEIWELENKVKV